MSSGDVATCVIWDLEDCPTPNVRDPHLVYEKMISVFKSKGYRGEVSVLAYVVDKKTFTDELVGEYRDAGIRIAFVPEGNKDMRVTKMLWDLLFWAMDHPHRSNLVVISKNISEDMEFVATLSYLKDRFFNVLVAEPNKVQSEFLHDSVNSVWPSALLLDGPKPIDHSGSSLLPGVSQLKI